MTDDLKTAINSLKAASPKLNAKTDEIAALVADVETFLNKECSIGLEADIHFETGEHPFGYTQRSLAYRRHNRTFRIVVLEEVFEYETHEDRDGQKEFVTDNYNERVSHLIGCESTPWSECTRILRLKSFAKLPDLLAAIARHAARAIEAAENAQKTVSDMLGALKGEE